ncbi:hypothetical protein CLLI_08910 [Clostridium liquoris]|uniref:Chromosome partition protein Smc n=1 Tax=Clostridium liquoris TaxID=1289519 RepID=A0A2T0B695_9CLOT|nr:phosphoenolpyruvate carboxylase [Clostridium liquoris]PRR79411.1 hypothetical protein CLLI_08910 [Clostridium liquoris]
MARNKCLSKNLICLVVVGSTMAPNVVYAKDAVVKDESVYVNLNGNGKVKEEIVSDWLHSDEENLNVEDISKLNDIKNVKGNEVPLKDGDKLTWKSDKKDIFYQGTTKEDPPVEISVKYYFDGKEVNPKDIAGESGKLKIKINYKNTDKQMVNINGKMKNIYTPMTALTVVTLPFDNFSNIKINDGTIISEGNNKIINFAAFPGMKESFDLNNDDINSKIPNELEINCDVNNFKMDPILITVTPQLPEIKAIKDAKNVDELKNGINDLQNASNELLNGILQTKNGAQGLNVGITKVKNGMISSQYASGKLSNGIEDAHNGLWDIRKDMDENSDKLSLVRDKNKVQNERKLIEDAFVAKNMDTSSLKNSLELIKTENMVLFGKTLNDFKGLDVNGILNNPLFKNAPSLADEGNTKKMNNLINDAEALQKIDMNKMLPVMNLLSKDNINEINNIMNQVDKLGNIDMKKIDELTGLLDGAESMSNITEKLQGISNMDTAKLDSMKEILNKDNLYSLRNVINQGEKLETIDMSPINQLLDKQIAGAESFHAQTEPLRNDANIKLLQSSIDSNPNMSTEQKANANALLNGYYKAVCETDKSLNDSKESINSMKPLLNSFQEMQNNLKSQDKNIAELNNILNEENINNLNIMIDNLESAKNDLSQSKNQQLLKGLSKENINAARDLLNDLKTVQNSVYSEDNVKLMKDIQNGLNSDNVKYMQSVLPKIASMKQDLDANKENLNEIKAMISSTKDPKLKETLNKVNVLQKDLEKAGPKLVKLQQNIPQDMGKVPQMMGTLTSMQQDLKDNGQILDIVNDALKQGNVDKANKLLDAMPKMTDGMDKLYSGSKKLSLGIGSLVDNGIDPLEEGSSKLYSGTGELYSGAKKFSDEGIGKINSKVTPKIGDINNIIEVKDKLYEMSKNYGTFTGTGDNMDGKVKFIMKTDDVKAPEVKKQKKEPKKVAVEEKKNFIQWIKSIL